MYIPPHLRKNSSNDNDDVDFMLPIHEPTNQPSWSDKIKMTKEKEKKKEYPVGYMVFEKRNNITTIVQNNPTIKNEIENNLYVIDRHNEYKFEDDMKDLTDGCIDNHNYDNEINHQEWLNKLDTEWELEYEDSGDESDSLCDSDLDYDFDDFK